MYDLHKAGEPDTLSARKDFTISNTNEILDHETYHMRMKMQGTHTFILTGLLKTESEKGSTRCMCKHTLGHEFFYIVVLWLRLMDNVVYRIAGNFRWVQIFVIFADKPAFAKIKPAKKCTKNGN